MNIIKRNWPENSHCSPRLSVMCTYVRYIFCIWTVWQWLCVPAACRVSHCWLFYWCSDYLNIYCPSWSQHFGQTDRSGSVSVTVWTDDDVFPLLLCCVSKTIRTLCVSLLSDRRFHTWTLMTQSPKTCQWSEVTSAAQNSDEASVEFVSGIQELSHLTEIRDVTSDVLTSWIRTMKRSSWCQ